MYGNGSKDLKTVLHNAIMGFLQAHPSATNEYVYNALAQLAMDVKLNPKPKAPEPDKVVDLIKNSVVKPEPVGRPSAIPMVEHNSKGPLLASWKTKELVEAIWGKLELTEWEATFLNGLMDKTKEWPQVMFTLAAARKFEALCYKAGAECPFHISPDAA